MGGDQDIHLGLFGHGLAKLGGDDSHKQYGQRAARPAQDVAGVAHCHQGEEHHGRGLESVADGHRHGRAAHKGTKAANGVAHVVDFENLGGEEADVELTAQGIQNGADE